MLDSSDPATMGLAPADLTGPDLQPCQELAAAAMAQEYEGLLVPSAALPGVNLVLLPRNLPVLPPIRIVRSARLPLETIARERSEEESE